MKEFHYLIKTSSGDRQKGAISADSKADAIKKLKDQGSVVLSVEEPRAAFAQVKKAPLFQFGGVSDKDKMIFTQQLAIMTKAGLPIIQALNSLTDETGNKRLSKVIQSIARDVEGGLPLSNAFAKHPDVFNPIYVSIVRAGEKSGKVDDVLNRLAAQLEKDYDIRSKVKGALSYPLFVLAAMVVIVTLIMIFIIPRIQSVFEENNAQLPLLTRIIIGISGILIHQYYIIIAVLGLAVVGYRMYYRSPGGKHTIDLLKLNIPIFGTLLRRVSIARFARIFSTLLAAGIPMLEIFETAQDVVGNDIFRIEIEQVGKDVENGMEISTALKKQPHIPRMMVQLTAVGEKSGNMDSIYENLAGFMEKEVDNLTRNLATLLEPALMLIMGVIIGTVVIAVLLPIYSLTSAIN